MPTPFSFPRPLLRGLQHAATVVGAALLLQACGGGDDSQQDSKKTIQPVQGIPAAIQAMREQRESWARYLATTPRSQRAKASPATTFAPHALTVQAMDTPEGGQTPLTPQQVRARYGLPALPANFSGLSAAEKASFGAGQTLVIVNPYHAPNLHAELRAFSERFGLPVCDELADWAAVRQDAAGPSGLCFVRRHYSLAATETLPGGEMVARQPSVNAAWSREGTALVQWAHAMAPLANIVLLEMQGEEIWDLPPDIAQVAEYAQSALAVVYPVYSNGGDWSPSLLQGRGISHVVPAGDVDQGESSLALSPFAVSVGASAFNAEVDVHDSRSRFATSDSYLAEYQLGLLESSPFAARQIPDLLFHGSAVTGQLTLVQDGQGQLREYAGAGTRLAAAQWAGVTAVANAQRRLAGKQSLSDTRLQQFIYGLYRDEPVKYAQAFQDVTATNAVGCESCAPSVGYDLPSGLGAPRLQALLPMLAAAHLPPDIPWVDATEILVRGQGAYQGELSWWAWGQPASLRLKSGPAGLTLSAKGTIQWDTPVAGDFKLDIEVSGLEFEPFTVTVPLKATVANQPPVLSLPAAEYFEQWVGFSNTIPLAVTDPEGDQVTASICVQGSSLCRDALGGAVAMPQLAEGAYTLDITARDSLGAVTTRHATLRVVQPPFVSRSIALRGTSGVAGTATLRNPTSSAGAVFSVDAATAFTVSADGTVSWPARAAGNFYGYGTVTAPGKPAVPLVVSLTLQSEFAPVVPSGRSGDAVVNRPFTLFVGASDRNPGDTLMFSLQGAPAGMTVDAVGRIHWLPQTPGTYSVTLVARDSTGLSGAAGVVVRVAPNNPPAVAASSWTAQAGAPFQAQVLASDPDGDALTYTLAQAPAGLTVVTSGASAGRLLWANPTAGTHRFQVTVRDAKGEPRSAWLTLNVQANVAPVVKSGQAGAAVVNRPFTLMVSASDANKDVLSYSLTGAPAGMTVDAQGRLHWTPAVAGSFTFGFVARDPAGLTGSAAVTVVVASNELPQVVASQWTATAGAPFTAQVQATDPDGDALTYALAQAPEGLTVVASGAEAGKLQWARPVAGTYRFQATVRDSKGAPRSAWLTLTVRAAVVIS